MAPKRPAGALSKGGGTAASGTKLVQPTAAKPTPSKSTSIDKQIADANKKLQQDLAKLPGLLQQYQSGSGVVTPVTSTGPTDAEILARERELQRQQDAAAEAERKRRAGQSAYDILLSEFNQYGLGSLVEPLKALIVSGPSEAELTLALRQTEPYKKRFAANAARINKGLRALSEAEYISLEDGYQNVMRNYGLPASYYTKDSMGTQAGFEKFIAGDVSPTELEERVVTAQKRVLDAAPEVTTALKQFYPDIKNGDILAYTLDPERGLADIKKKVTAAEIGGAALGARLAADVGRAEELARYGVTADTARAGFGAIGGGLERGRQLADIYQQPDYTQTVAEEEVFNLPGQTQAGQKRRKIIGMEKATFGGQTGITSGALSRDRAGSY
jgi:hypothetical protein